MTHTQPTASQAGRAAMLRQSYTPVTGAPVCINCRYRTVSTDMRERSHYCGLGEFRINNAGTCELHEPPQLVDFTRPAGSPETPS